MSKIMKDNGVKLLAAVMVLVMAFAGITLLVSFDGADVDAEDSTPFVPNGTFEVLTPVGEITGNGEDVVTLTYGEVTLEWYPKDNSIGRYQDGWWAGAKVIADESVTAEVANSVYYSNDGTDDLKKCLGTNKDGTDPAVWMGMWVPITKNYIEGANAAGKTILQWTYKFDWDGDKAVDQTFLINVDITKVTLIGEDGKVYYTGGKFVNAEAKIGFTHYDTLDLAINEATGEDVIVLLRDVSILNITTDTGVTIDGNNHKVTFTSTGNQVDGSFTLKNMELASTLGMIQISGTGGAPETVLDNVTTSENVHTYNAVNTITIRNSTIENLLQFQIGGEDYSYCIENSQIGELNISNSAKTTIDSKIGQVKIDSDSSFGRISTVNGDILIQNSTINVDSFGAFSWTENDKVFTGIGKIIFGDEVTLSAVNGNIVTIEEGLTVQISSGSVFVNSLYLNGTLIMFEDSIFKGILKNIDEKGVVNSISSINGIKAGKDGLNFSKGSIVMNGIALVADENDTITITGNAVLDGNTEVQNLVIASDATLTVPKNKTLTVTGDTEVNGTLWNEGTVENDKALSGDGTVVNFGEVTGDLEVEEKTYLIESNDKVYNGNAQTPSAQFTPNPQWSNVYVVGTYLYKEGSGEQLEDISGNVRTNVGDYRACIFLNYSYKGVTYTNMKLDFIWKITAVDLSKVTIKDIPNQDYTGSAIEPTLDITYNGVALELGTDYTVSFDDNINEGQATITVTGKGNYAGTRIINFWIIDMQSYLDALEEWIGGSEGLGKVVPGTENTTYAQVKDVYDAITAAYAGLSNANTPDELGDALDEGKFGILIAIKNEVRHYLQTVYNSGDGYYGRYMSAELYNSSLEAIGPSGAFTPTMVVNAYENALSQRTGLPLDTILSDLESWIGGSEGLGSKVPGSEMTYVETPRIGTAVLNAYSSINSSMTISEAQAALDAANLNILLETKDYVRHLLQTMYNGGLPYYGMVMTEETYNNALWQISPEGTRYTPTDVVGVVLWAMENRSQSESATLYNNGEVYRVIPYQYSGTPVNIKTAVDAIPAPTMESTSELVTYSFAGWVDENGLAIDFTEVTESFNAYAKYNATVDDTKALLGTDVWFGYMFSDENADPYNTTLPWFTINYQRLVDGVSIQVFIDDEPVFAEPFVGKVNLAAYVLLEIGNEITAGTHTIKISASVSAGEEVVKDEISVKVTVIDYVQVTFIDDGEYVDVQYPVNGTAVTLPTLDDKTGYEFVGWMDKDGKVVGTAGSAYTVDGKTTLTAKYDAIETESKVKLTVGDMIIGTYDKGTWVPVPLYTGTTPANQKFVGYTVRGVDYVAYPAGSVLQMNADVDLIPVFEYTVYQSRQVDDYKLFVQDIGEDKYYVYVLTDKIEGFKNVLSLGTIRMNATDIHNIVFSEVIGKKTVEGVEYGIIWSGEIKSDKAYAQVSLSVLFGNEFIMVDKMTVSPLFNDNYSENGPMTFQIVNPDDAPESNNYPWLQVNYGRNVNMNAVKLFIDDIEITEIVWVNEDGEPIGTPNTIPANQNAYFQLSFHDGDVSDGEHKFTICGTAAEGSVYDMIEMTYQVPDPYGTI